MEMGNTSILDYFKEDWQPTPLQKEVLLELEARWNTSRVFILRLETSSGKQPIAHCIAKWREAMDKGYKAGARIFVPTTNLVEQFASNFSDLAIMKSAGNYSCDARGTRCGSYTSKMRCRGCVYTQARENAQKAKSSVSTYHLGQMLYKRGTVINDESHNISKIIRDLHSKKIYLHKLGCPPECINDTELFGQWVDTLDLEDMILTKGEREFLEEFKADRASESVLNTYSWDTDWWSNGGTAWGEKLVRSEPTELPVMKQQAVDIYEKPMPFMRDDQKIVLLSATIGRPDLYELGLDKERPVWIDGAPPISPDRNPIVKDYIGSVSYANKDLLLQPMVEKLMYYLNTKKGRGVIHTTYSLAAELKKHIKHDRLITHGPTNMRDQLKVFLSTDNAVFLASGMYEGVSLDYDRAAWQVITKIVWPSLADPLQKLRAEDDPDYYLWSTLKTVIQTSGRVCRRADDYGETIILDKTFERLLTEADHLIPTSFKKRIIKE